MKKAIVWGSEGGIGSAIVDKLIAEGMEVATVSRVLNPYRDGVSWSFEADFSRVEDVDKIAQELESEVGQIDLMVYAAGDIASQKVSEADPERWNQIIDNNLNGVFHSLRASLPVMSEESHIFILGAVSERLQLPGLSAYVAAKAGLEAMVVSLAKEERKKKITLVRPGAVSTPLWDKVPFNEPAHTYQPEQVAERIWKAFQEGESGQVDLV